MNKHLAIFATSALSLAVLSGCSTTHQQMDVTQTPEYQALERELADTKNADARNAELESEIARLQNQDSSLLPPNPKPGECYARVVIPAKYQTVSETVETLAPSERIDVTPPEYRWVEKQELHKEASTRLVIVPATYKDVTETIQVSEPSVRLERVPATYKTVTERILVSPARTEWKKGTGPIQRIDESTGEIMCLVEVPAQYRTVSKRVVNTPESIRRIAVPGKNQTFTRHVVDRPASTRTIEVPATYSTVRVRQLVKPATQNVVAIPGKTDTITKRSKTADSYLEWRSILCETNTTPDLISRLQVALNDKGHNPGPIDGVYGVETQSAVTRYQKSQGLASGQLTIDTLRKLGVH